MKLVYDIECDGLDPTQIFCIVAINPETNQVFKYGPNAINDGLSILQSADCLIGHNIIGFDNLVIKKLHGIDLNQKKNYDTWIMSQVLNYRRPHKHGLAGWGGFLNYPKFDFSDFTKYSEEMMRYCVQDVKLNVAVYNYLMREASHMMEKNPLIGEGLRVEMETAKFEAESRRQGWNFDRTKAFKLQKELTNRMQYIERKLEPNLPPIVKLIDKEPKLPKFTKAGWYTSTTARMLSEYLNTTVKAEDTHIWAADRTFQRKQTVKATLGNMNQVKEWLYDIGWQPDDWKLEKTPFGWQKKSPKLTTTSLEKLGEPGKLLDEWTTLRSRRGVVEGWLRESEKTGRLHGRMWVDGTPTFRCRHEVIANLPAVDAVYGKELRELLIADDNTVVVGADSSGNQFRSLAHYVKDEKLTAQILSGDIHQYNANIIGSDRRTAKTWIYAFLFGAGATKLGQVLTGTRNAQHGQKSIDKYGNAIPGLKDLKAKLETVWNNTKGSNEGWIPGLDGRKLYTPQNYQVLNYLLQGCEGVTCKAAVAYQMTKIKEEGLRAEPRLFYHDETAWVAHPDDADRVGQILQESFREAPKAFGVDIMDGGDYVKGNSYADVH